MSVAAIGKYQFAPLDAQANFHGNILTYWHWEDHLMFCAPVTLPFLPDMTFGAVIEEALPAVYGYHPDFAHIDWAKAEWRLNGKGFRPDRDKTLAENGLAHKAVVTIHTPGLKGVGGSST